MLHKSFKIAETKATGDAGEFTALVSVFGNVDSVGDRILHGAYTETLKRWRKSGDPIPIILSHQWDNPMAHIGIADPQDVKQTPDGLVVRGKLDIADNDVAKQVYRLMKRRSLKEFSIGYRVPEGGETMGEDGVNDVTEIDLVEVGPTLKGANSETELTAIKSAIVGEEPPPRAESELRRQAEKLEQKAIEAELPVGLPPDPEPSPISKALESVTEQLAALQSKMDEPSEKDLRRRTDELERAEVEPTLPPEVEPGPDPISEALKELGTELAALKAEVSRPSEDELHRLSERLERVLTEEKLPPATTREQEKIEELNSTVVDLMGELTQVKAQLATASEEDQRRRAERLERERLAAELPPETPQPDPKDEELEALKKTLAEQTTALDELARKLETPSEDEQRRRMERAERKEIAETLPAPVQDTEALKAVQEQLAGVAASMEQMRQELSTPSEEEQRRRIAREERERILAELPPAQPESNDEELAAIKAQISAQTTALDSLTLKLDTPSDGEQRRRLAREERERIVAELPPALNDEELVVLKEQLVQQTAMLDSLAKKLDTPSEEDQRRRVAREERARVLAELPPATPPNDEEIEKLKTVMTGMLTELQALHEKVAAPTEDQLRRRSLELEREGIEKDLPTPTRQELEELQSLKTQLTEMTSAMEGMQKQLNTPSEEEQRRRAERLAREEVARSLPPETPQESEELEAVKGQLAAVSAQLENVQQKLDTPSEEDQRRRAERLERERIGKDLPPDQEPESEELQGLKAQIAEMTAHMAQLEQEKQLPSEEDQRRRAERLERERLSKDLPPETEQPNEEVEQLQEDMTKLAAELVKLREQANTSSEAELRRRAASHDRAEIEKDLPPSIDPKDERLAALEEQLAEKAEALKAVEEKLNVPDELELRRRARKADREIAEDKLPKGPSQVELLKEQLADLEKQLTSARQGKRLVSDLRMQLEEAGRERWGQANSGYVYVDDFDPEQRWAVFCVESAGDYRYVQVAYATEGSGDITLGTEELEVERATTYQPTGKSGEGSTAMKQEPTRARDSLKERSDKTVLEIQSGGASLRKPPVRKQEPQKEPIDEADLRRRSYKEMFDLLTEG